MRRAVCILLAILTLLCLAGCGAGQTPEAAGDGVEGSMELRYAENFAVDYYGGGAALLTIRDGQRFLLLPAGASVPKELEAVPQIPVPAENVYLASSSAADLFLQADALDERAEVVAEVEPARGAVAREHGVGLGMDLEVGLDLLAAPERDFVAAFVGHE